MSKFNVETPQMWKDELYAKTSRKSEHKSLRFKPVLTAAAVIFALALTTTAFAFTAMPDFFRSIFQGNNEHLDPLYMPKNIVLDSDTDEIEVVCTGIMGDKNNLAVSFAIKSKGSLVFDINNNYAFETAEFRFDSENPSNSDGYSSTFGLNYHDSKTLVGDLYISGSSGNGFTNKKLKIRLKNLECLKSEGAAEFEKILDCGFESETDIDYKDTSKKLSAQKTDFSYKNYIFCPVKAEISNISLNAEFKMQKGNAMQLEEEYPFDTITVTYKDGTVSEFNLKEETENQHIFYLNSVTKSEKTYVISGIFGNAVDASKVSAVEFDGIKLFAEQ